LYGLISYAVSQRTGEIGIRMAVGAQPAHVMWLVIREGMTVVAAGLVAGVLGALAATRLLESLLFGLAPSDPMTCAAAIALLGSIALVACVIPARRATRVNPIASLRAE